ncbi:hypothetical protein NEOLEDRAFT_753058 [Neolentinus lepideus HHB14362 ss-1]|uniref:Uncharacterized protein n=1 Tax=Neolentinus lepideus HHB14362 ss-1 TaxID=1314782 RepID=A0A165PUP2_9AGAM|nr:hypothetical protein NEOLEDRAFT_753058 [Neolentinus lepideus HHB14362 ss-1]
MMLLGDFLFLDGQLQGDLFFVANHARDNFFQTRLECLEVLQGRPGVFDGRILKLSRRRSCHRLKLRWDGCGKKDCGQFCRSIKIAGRCRSLMLYKRRSRRTRATSAVTACIETILIHGPPYSTQCRVSTHSSLSSMSSLLKPHIIHHKCTSEEESSPVISFANINSPNTSRSPCSSVMHSAYTNLHCS